MSEIKVRQQALEASGKFIRTIITELFVKTLKEICEILESDHQLFYKLENKGNEAGIYLFKHKNDVPEKQNIRFSYRVKIESPEQVIVYSSGLDPDLNAFRPKDIFGDFEKMDISNITSSQVYHNFLERFKASEIKKLESENKT